MPRIFFRTAPSRTGPVAVSSDAGLAAPFDPQREAMSLQTRGQADKRVMAQAVTTRATAALKSGDPAAAQEVMDLPGFDMLDQPTKQAIRRAVYGK